MAVTQEDTPVIKMTEVNDSLVGVHPFRRIRWVGAAATSAGDILLLEDANDNEVIKCVATGAYYTEDLDIYVSVNTPVLSTLDSGEVYLYR